MSRPRLASWMTPQDRDILQLLRNHPNQELVMNPGIVAANTDWSRQSVRKHMLELREQGLLEYFDEDRALYQLSDRGRAWLEGELPTEDLEDDD